jgi:hypothetical protein
MGHQKTRLRERRSLLLFAPAVLAASLMPLRGQAPTLPPYSPDNTDGLAPDPRMPNGKNKQELILKADYEQNVKDARGLIDVAKSFEEDLEKDDRYVLSLSSLKKLDEIERLTRRIRGRLKRF